MIRASKRLDKIEEELERLTKRMDAVDRCSDGWRIRPKEYFIPPNGPQFLARENASNYHPLSRVIDALIREVGLASRETVAPAIITAKKPAPKSAKKK